MVKMWVVIQGCPGVGEMDVGLQGPFLQSACQFSYFPRDDGIFGLVEQAMDNSYSCGEIGCC